MDRPRTIIHILSALDGKIIGPFMRTEAVRAVSEEYGRIRTEYHADAWLYGTVTTKEFTGYRRPELPEGSRNRAAGMAEDYIARQTLPCIMSPSMLWERSAGSRAPIGDPAVPMLT